MLFSIGRQLVSTAFSTSIARSVVLRTIARSQFQTSSIYRRSPLVIRGFASVGRPKQTSTTAQDATSTKKPAAKKSATKSKAKAEPKPKPKPTKKPLTEKKKGILERRELKNDALFTEPKCLPVVPWMAFVIENVAGKKDGISCIKKIPALAQEYKALPSSEYQRLESVSEQNKLTNAAAYKAWVESHPPTAIEKAIKARSILKKKYNIPKGHSKPIHDERLPKKGLSAYSLFVRARWASGDYSTRNEPLSEVSKKIAQEWNSTLPAERQPYEDLARSEAHSYEKAVNTILHRKVRTNKKSPEANL